MAEEEEQEREKREREFSSCFAHHQRHSRGGGGKRRRKKEKIRGRLSFWLLLQLIDELLWNYRTLLQWQWQCRYTLSLNRIWLFISRDPPDLIAVSLHAMAKYSMHRYP